MVERSGIDFRWDPLPRLLANDFNTLGVNVTTFRKPLKEAVTKVMAPSLRKNFSAGGRPQQWQPLVDATLQRKAEQGYGSSPLIATGTLERRAGAFDLWSITDDDASIPSLPNAIKHGKYHQTGWTPAGNAGTLSVDPRVWALFQEEDANDIEEIFFEWIEDRIAKDIKHGKRAGF